VAAVIHRAHYLAGIRYWRQDFKGVPRFEVFEYIGFEPARGLYYFRSYKDPKMMITKLFDQLNVHGFYPFCYDIARMNELNAGGPPDAAS
jgi:hypothetical protein